MRKFALLTLLLLASLCHGQAKVPASVNSGYRIAGTVVSATAGETIPQARLILAPTSGAQWAKTTLSGKDGRFSFAGLKADKYQLYAERAGFPRQGFDQHDGGYFTGIVTCAGQDSEHLVFRLQPASVIQGVITDEFNEPVRGAQVMIFRRGLRNGTFGTYMEGQDQTDDRGAYRFGSLLTGKYFIVVAARPWYARNWTPQFQANGQESADQREEKRDFDVAFPITYYAGTTEETDASEINLRMGQVVNANVSLRGVPAIRVQLQEPDGEQHMVRLSRKIFGEYETPTQQQTMMASPKPGRVIAGIAPGRYEVTVEPLPGAVAGGGGRFFRQRLGLRRRGSTQSADLSSDTTLDLSTFTTESSASINGLARAEGITLRNAFVQLRNLDSGDVNGGPIDKDGVFKVQELSPGRYEVSIANSSSVYLASMAASGAKASGRTLEITNGGEVQLALLLSKGIGEIKGTALRGDKGFAGAMIVLVPEKPSAHTALFRRDQSDSDGTFTLRQVVPGKYTLLAIKDGWELEWSNPTALVPYLSGGTVLEVQPSGKYDAKVMVQARTSQ